MSKIVFIRNGKTYITNINGKMYCLSEDHINYDDCVDRIRSNDAEGFLEKFDVEQAINSWSSGHFELVEEDIHYKGEAINQTLSKRVVDMINDDEDYAPMLKFIERLMLNPSFRAVNELYDFMVHECLCIDEDGYLIAYKGLKSDFTDCHTGTFDNSPGSVNEIARNKVDDNREKHCSYGFHAGSYNYASGFSQGRLVLVKIDPKDVVSIPSDSGCQKLRCCKYEVLEEVTEANNPKEKTVYRESDYFEEDEEDDEWYDEWNDDHWDDDEEY